MKKLILLILLIPSLCFGAEPLEIAWMNVPTIAGAGVAAASTAFCTDATHDKNNNAVVFCEDFEGDQKCNAAAGAASKCRAEKHFVDSTTCSTEPVYDYGTALAGNYSVYFSESSNGGGCAKRIDSNTRSSSYIYLRMKINTITGIDDAGEVQNIINIGGRCMMRVGWDGDSVQFSVYSDSEAWGTTPGYPTAGTEYHIWLEFVKNQATNGCQLFVNTTSAKPELPEAKTAGTNFDSTYVDITSYDFGYDIDDIVYDNILFNTSALGSQ